MLLLVEDDGDVVWVVLVVPVVLVPDEDVPLWVPVVPWDDPDVLLVFCACANPGAAPSATATTLAAKYRAAGRMNRLLLS